MFKSPNLRKCFVISHSRPNRSQKLQAMSLPIRWRWLIMVIYCLTSKPLPFTFLIFFLGIFSFWYYYISEYDIFFVENVKIVLSESWETLIMHLSVFVFVFCLQLYLFLFVYLYFWPILSRPKCDCGEHRRRSEVTFTFEDCLRAASAATHISGNSQKKTKIKILEEF